MESFFLSGCLNITFEKVVHSCNMLRVTDFHCHVFPHTKSILWTDIWVATALCYKHSCSCPLWHAVCISSGTYRGGGPLAAPPFHRPPAEFSRVKAVTSTHCSTSLRTLGAVHLHLSHPNGPARSLLDGGFNLHFPED